MCWPWWTRLKSPPGEKTDAENEPVALRGGLSVFTVHVRGAGRSDQDHRPRPPAIRRLHLRMLSGGPVRHRLGDVPGARMMWGRRFRLPTVALRLTSGKRSVGEN